MSEGNRGRVSQVGLAAALGAAIALGGYISWDALHQQQESQIKADERAAYYQDSQRKDILVFCEANELSAAQCNAEAYERSRPDQRDEHDLAAQQTMAAWTRAMGIAAIIGMGVGIFGLYLIWATFQATRDGVAVSKRTVSAIIEISPKNMKGDGQQSFLSFMANNLGPTKALDFFITGKVTALGQTFEFKRVASQIDRNVRFDVMLEGLSELDKIANSEGGELQFSFRYRTIFGDEISSGLQRYTLKSPTAGRELPDGSWENVSSIWPEPILLASDDTGQQQA